MTRPAMNSVATQVYDGLVPFNDNAGVDTSYDLAHFVSWLCDNTLQQVAGYASEGAGGEAPWSSLLDLTRVPDEAIKFLAQLVGVVIDDSLNTAGQKQQISDLLSFRRGSAARIIELLDTLTAAEGVNTSGWILRERYNPTNPTADSAYHFQVIIDTTTLAPSPDPTLLALQKAKPAGLVMHYSRSSVHDWQYVKDNNAHWSDVNVGTWNTVLG